MNGGKSLLYYPKRTFILGLFIFAPNYIYKVGKIEIAGEGQILGPEYPQKINPKPRTPIRPIRMHN